MKLKIWQEKSIEEWIRSNRNGIIEAATGTGKTWIGLTILKKYDNPAVIVPTKVLQDQWKARIESIGISCDIHNGESSPLGFGGVSIYTIQSAIKEKRKHDLIIYDEIHRFGTLSRSILFDKSGDKLGLTASIKRKDGGEGMIPLPIVYRYSYGDALKNNEVNKIDTYYHPVELTEKEKCLYYSYSIALEDHFKYSRNLSDCNGIGFRAMNKRKWLVRNATNKIKKAIKLIDENPNKRTITFCENIRPINLISEKLNCNHIVYHNKEKNDIEKFTNGEFNHILTAKAMDEGYDVGDLNRAIMVNFDSSALRWIQRNGRISRRNDGISEMHVIYVTGTIEMRWLKNITEIVQDVNRQSNSRNI